MSYAMTRTVEEVEGSVTEIICAAKLPISSVDREIWLKETSSTIRPLAISARIPTRLEFMAEFTCSR